MQADSQLTTSATESRLARAWWHPLWEFCMHVTVGTCIFVVITLPAVGLNYFVTWLASKGVDKPVISILYIAEYTLLVLDVALFITFLVRSSWRAFKEM